MNPRPGTISILGTECAVAAGVGRKAGFLGRSLKYTFSFLIFFRRWEALRPGPPAISNETVNHRKVFQISRLSVGLGWVPGLLGVWRFVGKDLHYACAFWWLAPLA